MNHDDDARVTALILNAQILERMGKARYYAHSAHCGCGDIYRCETDWACKYRDVLARSDSEIDEVIAMWMRG